MSSTGGTGPSPGRPYYPGSLPRRTGAGASFKVNPKVLLHVAGEPAVGGPECLGLRRLGVPHDAETVLVGVEGHYAVIAYPELLPAAGVVDMLRWDGCERYWAGSRGPGPPGY